jgi:Spy/CpxP family protein refolding chaperone
MMQKRLKQLLIGGAILAALALGSSASAGAATDSNGSSSTMATLQASSTAPLTIGRGGSVGAMHHVRDSWIHDLYLTDHQQYARHHQRPASQA